MRVRSLTALLVFTCAASAGPLTASAQNLVQVWQAALGNDPTYAAARANLGDLQLLQALRTYRQAAKEGVPGMQDKAREVETMLKDRQHK